ncbi:MAG: M13 family metallopeptidase [Saccharofermentans sp.]|nr:M13 family metallopeptidase [Saccharofermentans sp.]
MAVEPDEVEPSEASEPVASAALAEDDYYSYINYDRLVDSEFDYGDATAGSAFDSKLITQQVEDVITSTVAGSGYEEGTEEYIIRNAYNSFMAYDFEGSDIPSDLEELFNRIDNASSVEELMAIDAELVSEYGTNSLIGITIGSDYLNSGVYILQVDQYKSINGASFEDLEEDYQPLNTLKDRCMAVLEAVGHDEEYSETVGNQAGYIAMDIYNATDMSVVRSSMPFYAYQRITVSELDEIFTNVDIEAYVEALGISAAPSDAVGIVDRGQIEGVNSVLTDENLDALKAWEMSILAGNYMRFLRAFEGLRDYFTLDSRPIEEQAISEIESTFVDQTDPLFVEQYYDEETDLALRSMCDDIKEGYRELISSADWLTEQTQNDLLVKLDNIVYVTGSNQTRHDPAIYKDLNYDNYYELLVQYNRIIYLQNLERLGREADRTEVSMPMQIFNACYDPCLNNITITVAIANAPFFDINADYYTNLGGIGAVIAHEMGHAFDSNCIKFDETGSYDPSWIDADDIATLEERNAQAVSYFEDNFTIYGIYHVDGEQTLGENYADLGGMECVTSLAKDDEDLRLIFENYGLIWGEKLTDTDLLDQIYYDEHSPSYIRVNAILSTLDAFYEAYDVTEGDGMYIAPEDRISRWH